MTTSTQRKDHIFRNGRVNLLPVRHCSDARKPILNRCSSYPSAFCRRSRRSMLLHVNGKFLNFVSDDGKGLGDEVNASTNSENPYLDLATRK